MDHAVGIVLCNDALGQLQAVEAARCGGSVDPWGCNSSVSQQRARLACLHRPALALAGRVACGDDLHAPLVLACELGMQCRAQRSRISRRGNIARSPVSQHRFMRIQRRAHGRRIGAQHVDLRGVVAGAAHLGAAVQPGGLQPARGVKHQGVQGDHVALPLMTMKLSSSASASAAAEMFVTRKAHWPELAR